MADINALDKDDRPNPRFDGGKSFNEARNTVYGELYEIGLKLAEQILPGEAESLMAPFAAWLADRENGEEI
jgi:hypothetical protein